MTTYLDKVLAAHRRAAAGRHVDLDAERNRAAALPPTRGFRAALQRAASEASGEGTGPAVIAEVKRRSPSKGPLAPDLDAATLAGDYERGGATCLSVLTDEEFFGGSAADLRAARDAVGLPVLRKDFTVGPGDVCDARQMGADAVLLIAAALDDTELAELRLLAVELGLDALVEIHDEAELDRALAAGADLIGVNQRDLVTFTVDSDRACRMAPLIPDGVVRVAESGVRDATDAARLAEAGYHAVLVGESLVTSGDPAGAVAAMVSAERR